ncbi:hypothetical protein Sste5346_000264 [Sporothrix stenoceras]|uniref:RNase III domain-containing protein n=1 Tax=Sporothrix stenoceras TaxID=5173 RepID=A0ABR3ZT98_9PEZI
MSKRTLEAATEDGGIPKRQKSTVSVSPEKLALIKEYYKELRAFVKAAEQSDSDELTAPLERLVTLNKTTLPVLQALGGEESSAGQNNGDKATQGAASNTAAQTAPSSTLTPEVGGQNPLSFIPSLVNMTAWTVEDIPTEYPALPPIPDENLEKMALTHRGWNEVANYETLEFLGDAFIYYAASEIITQTFPRLTPGRKSQMREGLLRNSNLAQYTTHYGIEKRANFPLEFTDNAPLRGTKVAAKEREKVNGDLFEAYVGALIRARPASTDVPYDGVTITLRWLRSLWAMSLSEEIRRKYNVRRIPTHPQPQSRPTSESDNRPQLSMQALIANAVGGPGSSLALSVTTDATSTTDAESTRGDDSVPSSPKKDVFQNVQSVPNAPVKNLTLTSKVQLAALIGCKEVKIRYEDAPTKKVIRDKHSKMPLFTVAVWVDAWGKSECLGYGSALSKKEAGGKAAERALENKAKMKFFVAQKASIYGDRSQVQPEAPSNGEPAN